MNMKRVSFEVAKAIKEAGYPQNVKSTVYYSSNGYLCTDGSCNYVCAAPYVMEIWIWLWREKKIWLQIRHIGNDNWFKCWVTKQDYSDPEEAIIAAIEYLVTNDLIK